MLFIFVQEFFVVGLLQFGCNCWWVEYVQCFKLFIDVVDYFCVLCMVLINVWCSVFIFGWDIDSCIVLVFDIIDIDDGLLLQLGDLLYVLVECEFDLYICVLNWDYVMFYVLECEWMIVCKLGCVCNKCLYFWIDVCYLVGVLYYQKIVVIDDKLVFVGGFDLICCCWDMLEYLFENLLWCDFDDKFYVFFYDVQVMVDGDVVCVLGELVCWCWSLVGYVECCFVLM